MDFDGMLDSEIRYCFSYVVIGNRCFQELITSNWPPEAPKGFPDNIHFESFSTAVLNQGLGVQLIKVVAMVSRINLRCCELNPSRKIRL